MRIFLLSFAFLLAASPAFAGPGADAERKAAPPVAQKGARKVAERKAAGPAKAVDRKAVGRKAVDRKARPALAQGKTAWPKALQHRMSRYARFGRTLDHEGDLREELRASLVLKREEDVRGDRLEFARARLSERNRFASRNAILARQRGTESDQIERQLSRLTRARSRADFRRHMLIPAHEMAELKKYKAGFADFGNPFETGRLRMADKRRNERGAEAEARTKDRRTRDIDRGSPYLEDREREGGADERTLEREEERGSEIDDEGRGAERDAERAEEREGEKAERDGERDADRKAEREDDAEERSEEADVRSDERSDERSDDRADEKTINQAEEGAREE